MKIRLDYITNSSSSSYTCIICDNTESGMNVGMSELGMIQCENGHTMCEDHATGEIDDTYDFPAESCPVCTFDNLIDKDISKYLLKKYNINLSDLKTEMKTIFTNYNEFEQYIIVDKSIK